MGRFAGCFLNFPALSNFMLTFHRLTGSSCTMSLTLQGLVFPVALFSMWKYSLLHSIQTIL